ncbi:MAG: hypothetical protein MI867_02450 [Pseudomonadales bacterium]|nr:hypothetical protein [Pseudomonadales bacterium]
MTAIISGEGLGLFNTSANAINAVPEIKCLLLRGDDSSVLRTYNSQGSFQTKTKTILVQFLAMLKFSAGSSPVHNQTVVRTASDGFETAYYWSDHYESSVGDGTDDYIVYDSATT